MDKALQNLSENLVGELLWNEVFRKIYATDASVYRELPLAVAYPKLKEDIIALIHFANENKTSLIPRTAGTSLAGQCVGSGIVVDCSKYLYQILEVNVEEQWAIVQPGVIRNQLNHFIKEDGLFFGPNTSTANRAMIGGMVGNNSCGSYSIVYGTTREHVLELKCILSDGSEVTYNAIDKVSLERKKAGVRLENKIYKNIDALLSNDENSTSIKKEYPKESVTRRNTGYALDALLKNHEANNKAFNLCDLITGSEGTLCFITEIKIHLEKLPPNHKYLICAHFISVDEALEAVVPVMAVEPRAVELMDKIILDCTKANKKYKPYRFFVEDDPAAILIIEVADDDEKKAKQKVDEVIETLKAKNFGYAYPIVSGSDIKKVWDLRSAGLGLLANIPGDEKAVAIIEDTAVAVEDLAAYIKDFTAIMQTYKQRAVYYAHAGAGELHLRPLLNLKKSADVEQFKAIGKLVADLVKKYEGSMSGEHGDGRVRAEFIPTIIGEHNYKLCREIKQLFDPNNIFNPGKIVDPLPMDANLRYEIDRAEPKIKTAFRYGEGVSVLQAVEKCNGSGDCRKLAFSGGTMCPSYMATRNEKDSTRARANLLREVLTNSEKENKFDSEELKDILDLCLSCKGCTSECPSNVDMPTLKSEFLYNYYKANGTPLAARLTANINNINRMASLTPGINNFMMSNPFVSSIIKKVLNLHPNRKLPLLHPFTLICWFKKNKKNLRVAQPAKGKVFFMADEFTNFNDVEIGIKAIKLLNRLGYVVDIPGQYDSGRAHISMGLLDYAKSNAEKNVKNLSKILTKETPMLGVEPPAVLPIREEYPKLVDESLIEKSVEVGKNLLLVEEFICNEMKKGKIDASVFHDEEKEILLHGHCHHKAIADIKQTEQMLSLPKNYTVKQSAAGCCGMAGFFGFEKEHYNISMDIGELVLFPEVRSAAKETIIALTGASCRLQVEDGTERVGLHPVEILFDALV